MRRTATVVVYAALMGIICAGGLYASPAHAGNVLLPSDSNSSSSSLPSLGLGVSSTTSSTQTTTTTPPVAVTPPPTVTTTSTTTAPLRSSPPPSFDLKTMVTTPAGIGSTGGMIPTHIVHIPDTTATLPPNMKLPYVLNVTFSGQSVFGATDAQTLHDRLGLGSSQISSSCILTAQGIIQTDKGGYMISSNTGAQPISVRYDGMIKGYVMTAVALCAVDPNRIPSGAGFMTMVNNRLIIPLQPITCQIPMRQVSNMIISYDGTSSSHCSYN